MEILGIDIGGTGIKGAIVDTSTGELVTERKRLLTPQPATPKAVIETSVPTDIVAPETVTTRIVAYSLLSIRYIEINLFMSLL